MDEEETLSMEQQMLLHVAGATVRHAGSFASRPSPIAKRPLTREVVERYVIPFYFDKWRENQTAFAAVCAEATPELAFDLLAEFNWRTREIGALFVATWGFAELQEAVSDLFLKSEVCFVGKTYCLTLAAFENEAAAATLSEYLNYYLRRPDLWFDQKEVLAALYYLQERLGGSHAEPFQELWQEFAADKPRWDLDSARTNFNAEMAEIRALQQQTAAILANG